MTLDVQIYPKNIELTDQISDYVTKKVSKLDRFLSNIEETRVDLVSEKSARNPSDRQIAQITLRGRGFIMRTEEKSDDIFSAIDAALDKMQRKIERFKGKHYRGRGNGMPISALPTAEVEPLESQPEASEILPIIARRKEFILVPMDEAEALEQMTLLGHENFFIFYNANTSSINVLYRRHNGTYGIIEPKTG